MTYYFSKNSARKIYHTKECGYVNLISENNLKTSSSQEKLFNKGYTYCEHCSPAGKYLRANKAFFKSRPKKTKTYDVRYVDGDIEITSPWSKYLLVFNEGGVMCLYHKNTFEVCDSITEIPGYHLQRKGDYSLKGTMKYIASHDKYRSNHPVDYSPQLSEKIRSESVFKNLPPKYFKASNEKSERMEKIESFHEHGNCSKPKKSGGGRGQKQHINQKKKYKKSMNRANVSRVDALLNMLRQKAEKTA